MKTKIKQANDRRGDELVNWIKQEFERRQAERAPFELQWQLNLKFLKGDQYCEAGAAGRIVDTESDFYWQEREVYNHLAPIVETRLAKLNRVRPVMAVTPSSPGRDDFYTAKAATGILDAAQNKLDMDALTAAATIWSETCGTSFYKISWDKQGGRVIAGGGKNAVCEGEVCVTVCPPFEVYPDSCTASGLDECRSLMHARTLPAEAVKDKWGAEAGPVTDEKALVIEYYELPSGGYPDGRLIITAGDALVFEGALPYANGCDGKRGFPFAEQKACEVPGCFFGVSVLERSIPIQRAYNAVKNRKHEFLNRIAMGVLAVEDGSVDIDGLEEEGLCPGKVVVYRAGSNPPVMMDTGRLPPEFTYEEDRLLNEFISISGVSEIMRNSSLPDSSISGIAIQLLIEQDDTRLAVAAQFIKNAVKTVAQHILRLYKQFASTPRVSRITGKDGAIELIAWTKSDLTSDDIYFVTENELSETPAQKRNMVFELLKAGLLHDENGRLSNSARVKALEAIGFGIWENAQDLTELHIKKAAAENERSATKSIAASEIDDHAAHISEHIRYCLSNGSEEERLLKHIREHKRLMRLTQSIEETGGIGNGE